VYVGLVRTTEMDGVGYRFERAREVAAEDGLPALARKGLASLGRHVPRTGVPLYYRYRAQRNWTRSGDFDARPDPFRIVRVDPDDVVYNSDRRFGYVGNKYENCGLVVGGGWDRDLDRFGERTVYPPESTTTIHRSFVKRFEEGRDWEEVPYVRKVVQDIGQDSGWEWHGCESREEVMERCRWLDRLFEDIEENGYRSKRELLETDDDTPETNPERFRYAHDEVVVNVGRDGRLLFVGGHHRLSIAKILDVPEIPVRLFVRHRKWQELRDRVAAGADPPDDLGGHPDLLDLRH
jgi:hypothetical protein